SFPYTNPMQKKALKNGIPYFIPFSTTSYRTGAVKSHGVVKYSHFSKKSVSMTTKLNSMMSSMNQHQRLWTFSIRQLLLKKSRKRLQNCLCVSSRHLCSEPGKDLIRIPPHKL